MNPLPLVSAFIAAVIGVCVGLLGGYCVRTPRAASAMRVVLAVLASLAWMTFIGGLIYWYAEVEPRLDGSEGAGVGFGWMLVHVWGLALAVLLTSPLLGLMISGCRKGKSQTS